MFTAWILQLQRNFNSTYLLHFEALLFLRWPRAVKNPEEGMLSPLLRMILVLAICLVAIEGLPIQPSNKSVHFRVCFPSRLEHVLWSGGEKPPCTWWTGAPNWSKTGERPFFFGKYGSLVANGLSSAAFASYFSEVTEITNVFRIVIRNSDVKSIEFPNLQTLQLQWIVIYNCPYLENISFPLLKDGQGARLHLMGVPSLSDATLSKLRKQFPSSHNEIFPYTCRAIAEKTKVDANFIKRWSECSEWISYKVFYSSNDGYLDIQADVTQSLFDQFVRSMKWILSFYRIAVYNNHHLTSMIFPEVISLDVRLVAIRNCPNLVNISFPKLKGPLKDVKLGISGTPSVNMRSLDELDGLFPVRLDKPT